MTEANTRQAIWIPINPRDVRDLEQLLREADPFLASALDSDDPYALEPWVVNQASGGLEVRIHMDRNLISRIACLARGERVRQAEDGVFRLAAGCMAFLITGDAQIEPSTSLYEYAASAGSVASHVQLRDFRVADHIHPQAYLDVALGRRDRIPESVLAQARELVGAQSSPAVDFQMPLRHRRRHLPILTKIAVLERSPGSRMEKMEALLTWMDTDAYVRALPTLFACIYFGRNGPGRLLKGARSRSLAKCEAGINNASWDLTYVSYWADEARQWDPRRLSLFCSADRALLELGRAVAPRQVPTSTGRADLLQSHWGRLDAERLGRLLDDLERKAETDVNRSEVLRERLLGLDDLQAGLDRELAETFG